ncbi:hypothetical protein IAU59_004551 [Kwoniella sp. CBS 9459]
MTSSITTTSSDAKDAGRPASTSVFKKVEEYVMKCFDYQHPIPVTPGQPPGWTRPRIPISVDYVPKAEREAAADAYRLKLQQEREAAKAGTKAQ